jgi:hypothetical protein
MKLSQIHCSKTIKPKLSGFFAEISLQFVFYTRHNLLRSLRYEMYFQLKNCSQSHHSFYEHTSRERVCVLARNLIEELLLLKLNCSQPASSESVAPRDAPSASACSSSLLVNFLACDNAPPLLSAYK